MYHDCVRCKTPTATFNEQTNEMHTYGILHLITFIQTLIRLYTKLLFYSFKFSAMNETTMLFFPDPLTSEKSSLHEDFVGRNPERITSVFKLISHVTIKTRMICELSYYHRTQIVRKKCCESHKLSRNGGEDL